MPAVFVHVSDIHFGQEKDDRVYIHADVKQQLIADAKEVVSNIAGGVAHGILVTGDIAQSGRGEEYENAGKWLDELAASIGVEIHRVQMVPGNHDLDRSRLSFAGKHILDHIRAGGTKEYEDILSNPTDRAALFDRFEDYGRFSFGYNCPLNNEGAFASEMEVNLAPGRAIRFIRLNSSLLCHGEERDEHPELMIGARQFTIPRTNGVENIVLVHHPLHWYKDQDQVRDYIRSRARVFISGHEHDPKVSVDNVEAGCDVMMLAAGATVADNVTNRLQTELVRRGAKAEIVGVAPFSDDPDNVPAGFGIAELIDLTVGKPTERPTFWQSTEPTEGDRAYLSYRRDR